MLKIKNKSIVFISLSVLLIAIFAILASSFIFAKDRELTTSNFEQLTVLDERLDSALAEKEETIDTSREIIKTGALEIASTLSEKEAIKFKMMNASSFYDAIEGRYTKFFEYFDSSGKRTGETHNETINFKFDYKNIQGVEVSDLGYGVVVDDKVELSTNGAGGLTKSINNAYAIEIGKIGSIEEIQKADRDSILDINREHYRQQVFTVTSTDVIEPQVLAVYLLDDGNSWDVTGEETVFGREAYVIEGNINNSGKGETQSSFKLIVDKNCGVVFESVLYDSKGAVTSSEKVEELSIWENVTEETIFGSAILEKGFDDLIDSNKKEKMAKRSIDGDALLLNDETIDFYKTFVESVK